MRPPKPSVQRWTGVSIAPGRVRPEVAPTRLSTNGAASASAGAAVNLDIVVGEDDDVAARGGHAAVASV